MLFNNQERTTSYQTPLPQTYQPIIHKGETAHNMENGQDYTDSQKDLTHRPISLPLGDYGRSVLVAVLLR